MSACLMLSPRDQRYATRLRELIADGTRIARTEKVSEHGSPYIQGEDAVAVQAWLSKVRNLLEIVFGAKSTQFRHLSELMPKGPRLINRGHEVGDIVGLLVGSLDDLENSFLPDREMLIVGEEFDVVFDQAKNLSGPAYKTLPQIL